MNNLKNRDTHPHTIEFLAEQTGLNPNFIRRIISQLPELIEAYGDKVKEEKNRLYFDNNGFSSFKRAATLKEKNLSLRQIVQQLRAGLPPVLEQTPKKHPDENPEKDIQNISMSAPEPIPYAVYVELKESYTARLDELKEQFTKRLEGKDQTIESLNNSLKLLSPPPEQLKEAEEKRLAQKAETDSIKRQLEEAQAAAKEHKLSLQDERRAKETAEQTLRDTQQERDATKQKAEQLACDIADLREQEAKVLKELESLEGKWFAGGERKTLYAKLRELNKHIEKLIGNQTADTMTLSNR